MSDQPAGSSDQPPPARPEVERFGPLTLERLVKEDGRALILFRRSEPFVDTAA
jgi:hypothetical protein